MSILSSLQRTPEQDQVTEEALAASRAADKRLRELRQESERLHLQRTKRLREAAEAEFDGDASRVEAAQQHLSILENKLSANEAAQSIADERLAEAARRLHLANVSQWIRTTRRLTNKRLKYTNELTEHLKGYIHARTKLLEANSQLATSYPLPGQAPDAAVFNAADIDRLIEREILRIAGIDPLGSARPPGATNNPFLTLADLVPLATEIERANAYAIKEIEEGGPSAPSLKPGAKEPEPVLPPTDPDAALLEPPAQSLTEAQVLAMMGPPKQILIDNRKGGDNA